MAGVVVAYCLPASLAAAQAKLDVIEVRPIDTVTGLPAEPLPAIGPGSWNGVFEIGGKTIKADDLYVMVRLKAPGEMFDNKAKLELEVRDATNGKIVAGRTWNSLYVGPGGTVAKGLIAPGATCGDLVFRARYGGKAITTRLDFKCGE